MTRPRLHINQLDFYSIGILEACNLKKSLKSNNSFQMSSPSGHSTVELKESALDIVDSWLGSADSSNSQPTQPTFEKRAQRLGLGAKFVPHKKVCQRSVAMTH